MHKYVCQYCNRIVNADHDCANKPKRANKNNINSGENGYKWKKTRQKVKERDLCCVLCYLNEKFTNGNVVHHIIERSVDSSEENVFNENRCVYLCNDCHKLVHRTRDSWKDYVKIFEDYVKDKIND